MDNLNDTSPDEYFNKKYYLFHTGEVPEDLIGKFSIERVRHNRRYLRVVSFFGLSAAFLLSFRRLYFDDAPGNDSLDSRFLMNFGALFLISITYLIISFFVKVRETGKMVKYWQRIYMSIVIVNYMILSYLDMQLAPDNTAMIAVILFLSVSMWIDTYSYFAILISINLMVGIGYYTGVHESVMASELFIEMVLFSLIGAGLFFSISDSRMRNFVNENLLHNSVLELKDLSLRDPLTRLFNRRMMNEALDNELSLSRRTGLSVSVILIDLDRFKRVNDSLGHSVGDDVLKQTADLLNGVVRDSDRVYRFGGEEFLVMLPDTPRENAVILAERIVEKFRSVKFVGVPWTITASLGLADNTERMLAADLIKLADCRMYLGKDAGRDRFVAEGCNEEHDSSTLVIPD